MNEKVWWYLARSSGIVAMTLLVASVVWGVLLATRALRPHDRPAWLLDLWPSWWPPPRNWYAALTAAPPRLPRPPAGGRSQRPRP